MRVPASQTGKSLRLALGTSAWEPPALGPQSLVLCVSQHKGSGHSTLSSRGAVFCPQPHRPRPQPSTFGTAQDACRGLAHLFRFTGVVLARQAFPRVAHALLPAAVDEYCLLWLWGQRTQPSGWEQMPTSSLFQVQRV